MSAFRREWTLDLESVCPPFPFSQHKPCPGAQGRAMVGLGFGALMLNFSPLPGPVSPPGPEKRQFPDSDTRWCRYSTLGLKLECWPGRAPRNLPAALGQGYSRGVF